jgi:hypothetical protein
MSWTLLRYCANCRDLSASSASPWHITPSFVLYAVRALIWISLMAELYETLWRLGAPSLSPGPLDSVSADMFMSMVCRKRRLGGQLGC